MDDPYKTDPQFFVLPSGNYAFWDKAQAGSEYTAYRVYSGGKLLGVGASRREALENAGLLEEYDRHAER